MVECEVGFVLILINIEIFLFIVVQVDGKFLKYVVYMCYFYIYCYEMIVKVWDVGVLIYVGIDVGGIIKYGFIVFEVWLLVVVGGVEMVLGVVFWWVCVWLGGEQLGIGDFVDFFVFDCDLRVDVGVLEFFIYIVLRG